MSRIETINGLFAFVADKKREITPDYLLDHIQNVNQTNVACKDPYLDKYHQGKNVWRLLGGVSYLYLNGYLEDYMSVRREKKGILEAHIYCGYMFTEGYDTIQKQTGLIYKVAERVVVLNNSIGCKFIVPRPTCVGSAEQFMIRPDQFK